MKCKHCKSEIIFVRTSSGKEIPIDFSSLTPIDISYLIIIDANKHPIAFRQANHRIHWITHPECYKKEK